MKKIYFLLIITFLSVRVFAQSADSSVWIPPQKDSLLVMLDHVYNMDFPGFERMLDNYKKDNPERPEAVFSEIVELWMKVLADLYVTDYDEQFLDKIDSVIDRLETYKKEDPLYPVAHFYIDAATGFRAILHVTRDSWFSAALDGRKAISGIKKALEGKIPNPDAKLGTGLYLYYADIIPHRYPLLKPLFLFYPSGDKKQGIADLEETSKKGVFAKVVASYMYAVIMFVREKNYVRAYNIMHDLSERYPQNPIFLMWRASIDISIGKLSDASQILYTFQKRIEGHEPFYSERKMRIVNYNFGRIYRKQKKYEQALQYFQKAITPIQGEDQNLLFHFEIYSLLESGYCYEALKRWDDAKKMFKLVLDKDDFKNSHDVARRHLKTIKKKKK